MIYLQQNKLFMTVIKNLIMTENNAAPTYIWMKN
jgi:hypothetical protein